MLIKPIETNYKDCRFRSRLEARWAVFFDAAGIKWEYEPEGYIIGNKSYLPDFYLSEFDSFFEVKGTTDYDMNLLQQFSFATGKCVMIAVGEIPETTNWVENWNGFTTLFPTDNLQQEIVVAYGHRDMFLRCDGCGHIKYMNEDYSTMKDGHCEGFRLMPLTSELIAARSARFEYGEKG